ncbi:hypothetical protein ACNSO8_14390 [Yersinia sp. LJYL362]|uniref:hypothetical protein n=1 Tax=Yersinia sp. LJYL362 TaxID=3402108 RepID=UPI003AB52472
MVRDTDKQQQNVADLSRDVEHANNALTPIFDKEKEQNRLREINLIGEIGNQVYDARSGHINVIQSVDGKLLRITVPNNEMKIISVGPIRPNQVKNLIEKGFFVPLP